MTAKTSPADVALDALRATVLADFLALQAEARYGPRRYRNLPPVATETMAESDAAEARNRGDVNPRDTDKDARTW